MRVRVVSVHDMRVRVVSVHDMRVRVVSVHDMRVRVVKDCGRSTGPYRTVTSGNHQEDCICVLLDS